MSGAGIVADALTIAECAAHPLAVPTALVDQDSSGVRGFELVAEPWFSRMLLAALHDGRPHAVKVGMFGSAERGRTIARLLALHLAPSAPIVFDPVLRSGAGDAALAAKFDPAPLLTVFSDLGSAFSLVLTPNAPELGALLGGPAATTPDELGVQALALAERTGVSVLAKGGHVTPAGTDFLARDGRVVAFAPVAVGPLGDIHGTGCRLSSALAAYLARGWELSDAVRAAREFMARSFAESVRHVGRGRAQFVPAAAAAARTTGERDAD